MSKYKPIKMNCKFKNISNNKAINELDGTIDSCIKSAAYQLNNEFETVIINELEKRGYKFKNKAELQEFITNNCSSIRINNETDYFVNGEIFLTFIEDFKIKQENNKVKFSRGYYGTYPVK